jgi:hypothetical protein
MKCYEIYLLDEKGDPELCPECIKELEAKQ